MEMIKVKESSEKYIEHVSDKGIDKNNGIKKLDNKKEQKQKNQNPGNQKIGKREDDKPKSEESLGGFMWYLKNTG